MRQILFRRFLFFKKATCLFHRGFSSALLRWRNHLLNLGPKKLFPSALCWLVLKSLHQSSSSPAPFDVPREPGLQLRQHEEEAHTDGALLQLVPTPLVGTAQSRKVSHHVMVGDGSPGVPNMLAQVVLTAESEGRRLCRPPAGKTCIRL